MPKTITADQVPADLVWETPRSSQGQTVETSYAEAKIRGRWYTFERTIDHSDGTTCYYQRSLSSSR